MVDGRIDLAMALTLAVGLSVPAANAADPQRCLFIDDDDLTDDLAHFGTRCRAGDVVLGIVEERVATPLGYASTSPLAYVSRICDFRQQQIVTYHHPDPDRGQNVFTCVFTGRVLEFAPF